MRCVSVLIRTADGNLSKNLLPTAAAWM